MAGSVQELGTEPLEANTAILDALQNPIILSKIIHALSFNELKACRLVNRQWLQAASSSIRKRDLCKVRLAYDPDSMTFRQCQQTAEGEPLADLSALNGILDNSANFPCTNFEFQVSDYFKIYRSILRSNLNLMTCDVQSFFSIYGDLIRTLTTSMTIFTSREVMYDVLLRQAPNIETLELLHYAVYENETATEILCLPSLKKLKWLSRDRKITISEILQNAPNLQEVEINTSWTLTLILESGKAFAVKKLSCSNHSPSPKDFLAFAQANRKPELEELTFAWLPQRYSGDITPLDYRMRLLNSLRILIETCKDSLNIVDFSKGGRFANEIELPIFSHLTTVIPYPYSFTNPEENVGSAEFIW